MATKQIFFGHILTIALVILTVSSHCTAATTTETVVAVVGTSGIYEGNVAAARSQAISDALITAIDQASAELMPLPFRVDRFQMLSQLLYGQAGKYILGYKVLTEATNDNKYQVLVEATVAIGMLRQNLADAHMLPEKTAHPRILLLITEQNPEDAPPDYWWKAGVAFFEGVCEIHMREVLAAEDFPVIEHSPALLATPDSQAPAQLPIPGPSPGDQDAISLANRFQADVVIVAEAKAQSAGNIMENSVKSFKGLFKGRAIRTDTRAKIAETTATEVVVDSDSVMGRRQALAEVGASAARRLASQILTAWRAAQHQHNTATLVVAGSRNLANFVKFRNLLRDLPIVKDVEPTAIKRNETILLVRFQGTTQSLADALMLKSFDSFTINISDISEDYIHMALVSN